MPVTIPEPTDGRNEPSKPSFWKRIGWFVLLYLVGVGSVGLVAFGLRLWIKS